MEIDWIKIAVSLFDNRKIKQIESLPDGDSVIVIWVKLLCLAGEINDSGKIYFTDGVPYTDQMLSVQLNRPLPLIQMSLNVFTKFGMIDRENGAIHITNWDKYQAIDRMNEIREYNRLAKQRSRERLKAAESDNVNDKSMTSQRCHDTESEEESDKESEYIYDSSLPTPAEKLRSECPYKGIMDAFNSICTSYPKIRAIEGERKKAVGARFRVCPDIETFKEVFRIAENSDFLKGKNGRNWSADFDWLMKAANWSKVLEHKYDERKKPSEQSSFGSFDTDDFIAAAMARSEEEMRKRDWSLNTGFDDDDGESSGFSLT